MTRRTWVVVGTLVVILVLAALPVLLGGADGGTTPSPADFGQNNAQPDISPAPLPTPDPTEPPDQGAPVEAGTRDALAGTMTVRDPVGDVTDTAGQPPPRPEPGVDLVAVTLSGDNERLIVTWETAGPIPAGADFLLWSLDLWTGDELTATISVQQDGARRPAGVLDWTTGAQVVLPEGPEVDGSTIRLIVPLSTLPTLQAPVTWTASGQLDGGFEDRVPDEGRAPLPG